MMNPLEMKTPTQMMNQWQKTTVHTQRSTSRPPARSLLPNLNPNLS